MHESTCEMNPKKKDSAQRYSTIMQVGGGVNNGFDLLESALGGVFQNLRYIFSDEEQKDLYNSLETVVKSIMYGLLTEATGTFKWYLGLKAIFHKAANPEILSEPPYFFRIDPFPSYHKYDDRVLEIVKSNSIDNYGCNGFGWVSRLVSLDVSFAGIDDPLKAKCDKHKDGDEDKDND